MTCPKSLHQLLGTLEQDTDHQGPMDHYWDMVEDPALQHHTDILKRERSPQRSHGPSNMIQHVIDKVLYCI